jgi:hypothetical protein
VKKFLPQWAGLGYGRQRRAHMWRESESDPFFAISNCGKSVLKEQLRSAIGLERCKNCEKPESGQ